MTALTGGFALPGPMQLRLGYEVTLAGTLVDLPLEPERPVIL